MAFKCNLSKHSWRNRNEHNGKTRNEVEIQKLIMQDFKGRLTVKKFRIVTQN